MLGADLREDQVEDVAHDPSARDDPHRRDDHAFLEHLPERSDRGGRTAADVDVVGEVGDVAQQRAVVVDGRDQADVVQVDAARERLVRDDHVAGLEVLRAVVEDRARHLLDHRAEVDGLREALRDCAELGVEERAREVGARLDVGRVRAAAERQHHLVRRRDERVADHLERDRVERHARFPGPQTELNVRPSAKRLPDRLEMSISGSWPAITDASASPIAGPSLKQWPLPPKAE